MTEEKKEMLLTYIKENVAPILVDFISGEDLVNAVVIPAGIDSSELVGHYEEADYKAPKWLESILSDNLGKVLVIDKIDSIPKDEQTKFVEILKYRQVSTFKLPENCVILVTADKVNESTINEEIISLVAKI